MFHIRSIALTACWLSGVFVMTGCSSSEGTKAPTEIKGMTPAEYREKAEHGLGGPSPGSPAPVAKPAK